MGFVYKWLNVITKMYYIGSHKGEINDKYIGSGIYFKRAYKKQPEHFTREILYIGEDYREVEEFILKTLDAENNNLMYNLKNGALGGKTKISIEGRKRLSESKKGDKNPNFGKPSINRGKPRTDEVKEKISKANKGHIGNRVRLTKYLFSIDGENFLTASQIAPLLGYKDMSTLRDFASGRIKNNKLTNLVLVGKLKIKTK